MCVPGAWGGQKKASGPLELESQMVLSHHVEAGIDSRASVRAAGVLNHLITEPALSPSGFVLDMVSSHTLADLEFRM